MIGLTKNYIKINSDFIGVYDAIIVKYDKNGKIEWKNSFGGSYGDSFQSVKATEDGGCIVVGSSKSEDGDMNGLSSNRKKYYKDAIIVKYDKYGNVEWKKSFGGNENDSFYYVVVEEDGGYKAVGESFLMMEICKIYVKTIIKMILVI